ncbi:hypothetical protein HUU40_20410, partial [candidate division KSB1 bacterium]|nr:hypothetical protein [candidate division KSB1 bacterium]
MTQTQRVLGTSIFSLLLVVVGLFVVCSGRVQNVGFEDEFGDNTEMPAGQDTFGPEGEVTGSGAFSDSDVLSRLDMLENESEASPADDDMSSGMFTDMPESNT